MFLKFGDSRVGSVHIHIAQQSQTFTKPLLSSFLYLKAQDMISLIYEFHLLHDLLPVVERLHLKYGM